MSLKTISEAASQVGVKREILEDWIRRGLLTVHRSPAEVPGNQEGENCVDEEQLANVAESLGWLQVSAEGWDGEEGE
jgi:predicted site-specific integrase-resolvase